MGDQEWVHVNSRRRRNPALALLALAIGLALSAPPVLAASSAGPSSTEPVTVTVPMRTITTPGTSGLNGILEIRVGSSAPFLVMLDTGSVGLRVFPGAWGSRPDHVRITSTPIITSSAGSSMKGFVAKAPITIGGVTTTHSVGFQLVNTDSPYIKKWAADHVYGILGVGTGRYALSNPLSALPGSTGLRWSIHFGGDPATGRQGSGSLVLGAEPAADADATFDLPPMGPDGNGALLWDDHQAPGCWTFGHEPQHCVDTWFDSGFTVTRVKGAVFNKVPHESGAVRTGTDITLAESGSAAATWQFPAGSTASVNLVRLEPEGRAQINTGNALYFQYTFTYDVERGLISLSRSS